MPGSLLFVSRLYVGLCPTSFREKHGTLASETLSCTSTTWHLKLKGHRCLRSASASLCQSRKWLSCSSVYYHEKPRWQRSSAKPAILQMMLYFYLFFASMSMIVNSMMAETQQKSRSHCWKSFNLSIPSLQTVKSNTSLWNSMELDLDPIHTKMCKEMQRNISKSAQNLNRSSAQSPALLPRNNFSSQHQQ